MKLRNIKTIKKHRWIFLAVLFILLLNSFKMNAQWTTTGFTGSTWWADMDKGYIEIDVMYFDSHGSSEADYHAGLSPGDGHLDVTLGGTGTVVHITCDSGGNSLSVTTGTAGSASSQYTVGPAYTNGNQRWVPIYWYISQSQLNVQQNIQFSGQWWRRGAATSNWAINASTQITPFMTCRTASYNAPTYTGTTGNPTVSINWSKSGSVGNADTYGTIALVASTGSTLPSGTTSFAASAYSSGTIVLNASGSNPLNLNVAQTYKLVQTYTFNDHNRTLTYTTESPEFTVPAYPQANDDFKATFDQTQRQVTLSWSIPNAPANNYVTDNFAIKIERSDGQITYAYVPYKGGITGYSYSFSVDEGSNYTYNFSLYRTTTTPTEGSDANAGWEIFTRKFNGLDVNTVHTKPTNAQVALAADNQSATVTWDIVPGVWSSGSKFVITRINQTTGGSSDITLAQDGFNQGSYTDNLIKVCNEYVYQLTVIPNESYGSIPPASTGSIMPSEIGTVLSVTASKGYYSDRTEINWLTQGSFDAFAVMRKPYGADDSQYKQIGTMQGSEVTNVYLYKDDIGIPGVVYEYLIKGLVNCGGSVIESNTGNPQSDIGFRTPTGDFYGRITFDNGQAVEGVTVKATTDDLISASSLAFTSGTTASIDSLSLLQNNTTAATLQAWVAPSGSTGLQRIVSKSNMYELGINSGYFYFKAGNTTLAADTVPVDALIAHSQYMHLTGVYTGDSIRLYINGDLKAQGAAGAVTGNANPVLLGGGIFAGNIDEVRIWGAALSADTIQRDYNRYLIGNEKDLLAYYTFNYVTDKEFYDISYTGADYHQNHGLLGSATVSNLTPTVEQLGYKGVTLSDGSYQIRSVPYMGNGTAYNLTPNFGIHVFESQTEVRFINAQAQSYTVNFTDKSSFHVKGFIYYENSIIPVQGVQMTIDGKLALQSNGMPIVTLADGSFDIEVPVGVHQVNATLVNHTFVNDGRITDPNGVDLNYQDASFGWTIYDNTKIKLIGRVAGGTIQEAYPLGHSLSTNNLAEGMTVTLTHTKTQTLTFNDRTVTETHFQPSNAKTAHVNTVRYKDNQVIINVNDTTGEFVAYLIPEQFTVQVNAPGHPNVDGSGSLLDLSQMYFGWQQEIYQEPVDSVQNSAGTGWDYTVYPPDTVYYQAKQKYIKRYPPEIRVSQLNANDVVLPFFGSDTTTVNTISGALKSIPLWNGTDYFLGLPVFVQNQAYKLKLELFENYIFYDASGKPIGTTDEVPTQDAVFKFNNDLAILNDRAAQVNGDDQGTATYTFTTGDPELTSAIKTMALTVTYGDASAPTSINWNPPANFPGGNAYILGGIQKGTDFVTAGPDKILTVLRDPPGSESYSFLETGVTFNETSVYTGAVQNDGTEEATDGVKTQVLSWAGVGAGESTVTTDVATGATIGVSHSENYTGQDTQTSSTTTTTRFQTSASPDYVGAEADVYIGYSTNITVGSTDNVSVLSRADFDAAGGSAYYNPVYKVTNDVALVHNTGTSVNQAFATLFAYPQSHIENVLIPGLKNLRNALLLPLAITDTTALRAQVNADTTKVFYVSYFDVNDANFGKSNDDTTLVNYRGQAGHGGKWLPNQNLSFDGPSYKVIYNYKKAAVDTISYLNQSVDKWIAQLADNEQRKVQANQLQQNYSFQGGSSISYSEQYSNGRMHQSSFVLNVGGHMKFDTDFTLFGANAKLVVDEKTFTTQGGTFSSSTSRTQTKGFVLQADGTDYLSVDVLYEPNWTEEQEYYDGGVTAGLEDTVGYLKDKDYYSSFIFRTRGGATSCPYEGEYVTKYYQPGQHVIDVATLQKEVPYIDMPTKFIENVPSGETAKFTLLMRNNSESKDDAWYNLKIVSSSNPYGAKMFVDGAAVGNGLEFLVPAGQTLTKTLEVGKGAVMNYDNLQICLQSQCQDDISDTVTFNAHFTPSCTAVNISKPSNNWTYNTKLPTVNNGTIDVHYMDVVIDGFDVNYDNFNCIRLQYKSDSQSDDEWITLMSYYNDPALYQAALANGLNAAMINAADAGTITYRFFMDDMPDQFYDLRAVGVCNINNQEVQNESAVSKGIKDMYCPRLFGAAEPANGILGVGDEIRLNFNEPIASGLLVRQDFQVQGVRNGTISDHSTSVRFDGINDFMDTEATKNLSGKDITVEMWIQPDKLQNATLFSHGDINESMELALTDDGCMTVKVGNTTVKSPKLGQTSANPNYADGSWAHVALVYNAATNKLSADYNFNEVISMAPVSVPYGATGNFVLGKSIATNGNNYAGKMHNVRVWEKVVSSTDLQLNSLTQLAGIEEGLLAYYPMDEGRGTLCTDKALGATMTMEGAGWALPAGYAATTNGSDYLKLTAGSYAFTKEMDYTIEFWFKANAGQTNATMMSAGSGEADSFEPDKGFSIGFDSYGQLAFANNGVKTIVSGEYRDNNWHHFAFSVNRAIGRAQIYMDGNLTNYIDASSVAGIATDYIYIGVRGWYKASAPTTLVFDNYFKGTVDDVRFWNLYRSETIVRNNNNVKLTGNEMGLIHYYPFDTYTDYMGVKFLSFIDKDMRISNTANPNTDSFSVVGGTESDIQSSDIAPLKDSGPLADLDFDFVVNNDALIITLNEPEYKITKTIVTFTVTDVRDLNGNSIVSPITWSAYIDRNQVRWETDRMDITKPVYDPYEFSVKAMNTGGSVQDYTINNIPPWLDVTPSSGTLNPASYDIINFSVNKGLNVGTYNDVIYLTNEDNVAEPLTLNLTVVGQKPDWSVNPSDFKYNMSVFGKMRFNNIFSTNAGDMLAAFDSSGKCIGVTNSIYNQTLDMWYAMLTVYNNEKSADGIEFRMWEAATGKTYKATPSVPVTFVNNSVVGDVSNPIIFDGSNILFGNIPLTTGWNWISFNLKDPNLSDINKELAFADWTKNDQIKTADDFASYSESSGTWVGTLSGLNNTSMYILHSSSDQSLSISGSVVDPPSAEGRISVQNGWNYIGYIPMVNMTVKEALAGYDAQKGDIVKSPSEFAMFSNNEWVGSLENMEAGKGYMLLRNANNATSFNYPTASAALSGTIALPSALQSYRTDFANNMVVVATTTEGIEPGDKINAYINGQLRGSGDYVAYDGSKVNFITISGDEPGAAVSFEWERNGKILGRTSTSLSYTTNGVTGSVKQPLVLDFKLPENMVSAYPNPFTGKFYALINSTENTQVQLTLSDVLGRPVLKEQRTIERGINRIELDGSSLGKGVYILKVTANGILSTCKVEKK